MCVCVYIYIYIYINSTVLHTYQFTNCFRLNKRTFISFS